jgi:hypothetical protein
MGDYVKKSMSSDWTRFRDLKVRALLYRHPGRLVMPIN